MSIRHSISSLLLLLIVSSTSIVSAQLLPSVCGGSSVRYGAHGLPNSTYIWTVNGGTIVADYNDSIDVLWDNASGTRTISYHEISDMGCVSNEQIGTVPVIAFNVDLEDGQGFCYGDSLELSVGTFDTIIWNGSYYGQTYIVHDGGWVTVYVKDIYGCSGSDSSNVEEYSLPDVTLMNGNDTLPFEIPVCGNESLEMTALITDGRFVNYAWSSGESTQSISIPPTNLNNTTYTVTVTDEHTCQGMDSINILPCGADWISDQIPNTITPKGTHPTWRFTNVEFAIATIKVFDRSGRLVWNCDGYCSEKFDGRDNHGRELPMDSYFYIMTLREGIGQITGTITIIR